jgi:hypothetical protein
LSTNNIYRGAITQFISHEMPIRLKSRFPRLAAK